MVPSWMGGWRADATWLGWASSRIVSIGHMRPGLTTAVVSLAVVVCLEAVYILVLRRRMANRADAGVAPRLDKLAAALALLTDVTEAGFTTVAAEVQRVQAKAAPARASSRRVTKRVSAAAARGESAIAIAAAESLSEDEVHLRTALVTAPTPSLERVAALTGLIAGAAGGR